MKRMERDIICGMAERCGLAYIRVLGYAVRVDGYIFLDFAQARGFILRRAEHGIDAAAKPSRAKSRVFDRVLLGVVLLFGIASISSFVWYFHGQTGANEPSHDASVRVSTDTPPAPSMPSSEQPRRTTTRERYPFRALCRIPMTSTHSAHNVVAPQRWFVSKELQETWRLCK